MIMHQTLRKIFGLSEKKKILVSCMACKVTEIEEDSWKKGWLNEINKSTHDYDSLCPICRCSIE